MGLDMYLTAERYLSDYRESDKPLKTKLNEALYGPGYLEIKTVTAEAMYWRKANAIHTWFVRECQDGVDECQKVPVSREKLQELYNVCSDVIYTRNTEPLTTASGFFFGGTEYDEYYFEELVRTVDRLEELLGEDYEVWDFYYQSSW